MAVRWPRFSVLACALVAGLLVHPGAARADDHRLHWDERNPRVMAGEYFLVGSILVSGGIIEFTTEQPIKPKWVGPILFDEDVRDALVMPRLKNRQDIETVSDVLLMISVAYPFVIDATLIP